MLQFSQLSPSKIDAPSGVIYGVCVMSKGEAKGHNLMIDATSLDQFLALAKGHKDGVKVRFGENHDAKVDDTVGVLKDLRIDGERVLADMHLLISDSKCNKLLEMAEKMPNEFGLSAVADAEKQGKSFVSPLRFTSLDCVDIVDSPAATKGLFFSQQQNKENHSMKNIAIALGLPETATEEEIVAASKVAFEAKCKADAEAEEKEKKKELESDDEEKGKEGKKKFEAIEAQLIELSAKISAITEAGEAAKASAHKAEIENLKLEASKEGKVISLSDEAILKLSVKEVKEHIAALPKNQVKLAAGGKQVAGENKPLDRRSPEFKAQLSAKKAEGALLLGQKMAKN